MSCYNKLHWDSAGRQRAWMGLKEWAIQQVHQQTQNIEPVLGPNIVLVQCLVFAGMCYISPHKLTRHCE